MLALSCWLSPSSSAESLSDVATDSAHRYHGEREFWGYNRSRNIDAWNRLAGVPKGSSWCMSYLYSMFELAARALGIENPLMRTASCAAQLRHAVNYGSGNLTVIPIKGVYGAVGSYQPRRGDIAIWKTRGGSRRDIGRLFGPGHTGIVVFGEGDRVLTIEGNTGSNFADGDGVYRKWRPIRNILAIIRVEES